MIKFFRKIRQKLLTENKFSQYLIYAIGEIVLVIIGILIALNINNYHEDQKMNNKITQALREIHRDLSNDIIASNSIILAYKSQDSLIHEILTDKITHDDYKGSNGRRFSGVGLDLYPLELETNGYELLMSNSDRITERYQHLTASLNEIYVEDRSIMKITEDAAKDYLLEYWSYLAKEMKWFSEFRYTTKLSEGAINYFAYDPHYKNHLSMYYMLFIENHYLTIHSFRLNAEDVYQELTDLLQLNNIIASDSTYYSIDVKDYEKFLGTYEDSINTSSISVDLGKLYFQGNMNEKARIFPISENSFIKSNNPGFCTIEFDSTGHATYIWQIGQRQISRTKTN